MSAALPSSPLGEPQSGATRGSSGEHRLSLWLDPGSRAPPLAGVTGSGTATEAAYPNMSSRTRASRERSPGAGNHSSARVKHRHGPRLKAGVTVSGASMSAALPSSPLGEPQSGATRLRGRRPTARRRPEHPPISPHGPLTWIPGTRHAMARPGMTISVAPAPEAPPTVILVLDTSIHFSARARPLHGSSGRASSEACPRMTARETRPRRAQNTCRHCALAAALSNAAHQVRRSSAGQYLCSASTARLARAPDRHLEAHVLGSD